MYSQVSNICSEIQIFKFEYISSGHYIYVSQNGSASKNIWETLTY